MTNQHRTPAGQRGDHRQVMQSLDTGLSIVRHQCGVLRPGLGGGGEGSREVRGLPLGVSHSSQRWCGDLHGRATATFPPRDQRYIPMRIFVRGLASGVLRWAPLFPRHPPRVALVVLGLVASARHVGDAPCDVAKRCWGC